MELKFSHIYKSYGNIKALVDFDIVMHNGIYALLGPNGSGKSTLMHIITQGCKPDSGKIMYNGTEIDSLGRDYRALIGFVPQNADFPEHFTCMECMQYLAILKGLNKKHAKQQSEELLAAVDLYDAAYRKVGGFSGGMKQRLLIAQALLGEPKLLILDEPTAGLDPLQRIRVKQLFSLYAKKCCVLIATHIVSDIEDIATHLLFLKNGHLAEAGLVADVIKNTPKKLLHVSDIENCYYVHFGETQHEDVTV